jgi:hypothetical protein
MMSTKEHAKIIENKKEEALKENEKPNESLSALSILAQEMGRRKQEYPCFFSPLGGILDFPLGKTRLPLLSSRPRMFVFICIMH